MTRDQRAARSSFPDWRFAPNIGGSPDVYEIENQALDRGGHVLDAMRALAPWAGRTLVDLGCGPGEITCELARRHPSVAFTGFDHSPVAIERAGSVTRRSSGAS